MALILPSGAVAMAQSPTGSQVQLADAGNVSKAGKEDEKEGGKANDRAKDSKDNAELTEEMRRIRQLIERLEARISQLEAEKSAAMVKPATALTEAPRATAPTPSASPTPRQTSAQSDGDRKALDLFRDTTISGTIDGYYGYNFNRQGRRLVIGGPKQRH